MASQKHFLEIMEYDVHILIEDTKWCPHAKNSLWFAIPDGDIYMGSKFDSIPYKPFKICSGSFSLEPTQN